MEFRLLEPVNVFDVVGAGDTFLSALVYFYLKCGRIENAYKMNLLIFVRETGIIQAFLDKRQASYFPEGLWMLDKASKY